MNNYQEKFKQICKEIYDSFKKQNKQSFIEDYIRAIKDKIIERISHSFENFADFLEYLERFLHPIFARNQYYIYHDAEEGLWGHLDEPENKRQIEFTWKNWHDSDSIISLREIVKYITDRDIQKKRM